VANGFPSKLNINTDTTVLDGYARDSLYECFPKGLARPKTAEEVSAILAFCHENYIAVTPCGNQTSMTGASVSDEGIILSTEKLSQDWRIYEDPEEPGVWLVDAGPAVVLGDLQDGLHQKGFFYPPDPTSRREVLLGATLATNASGEDTYKYGATRAWVKGLTFVKANGERVSIQRPTGCWGDGKKNTCGYPVRNDLVDALIGSEGTLGVITRATLRVLPRVPKYFAILLFLPCEKDALEEVSYLHQSNQFELRCLEYMDQAAVSILMEKAEGLRVPQGAGAALYIKQEFENNEDEMMELWLHHLEDLFSRLNCLPFLESVQFAGDTHSQELLRQWRHAIPASINERATHYKLNGGGKVGTDWYVPVEKLVEMFQTVRKDMDNMEWVVFGHIGNGHPHFNFVAKDAAEYTRARALLEAHCQLAVEMGGGVSGEHGLGKLKTHLLKYQYPTTEIEEMLALKKALDPHGILAPGNIFPKAEALGNG